MSRDSDLKVLDVLKERGLISSAIQNVVQGFMKKWNVDSVRAVLETHIIDESKLADVLAEEHKSPRLTRVRSLTSSKEVLALIPYDLALDSVGFPFELSDVGNLHVVFADPFDSEKLKYLESLSKKTIEVFVGERSEIIATIQRHYPLNMQLPSLLGLASGRKEVLEFS